MSIKLNVKGAAPHANDPHEAVAVLHDVPRSDDQLSVWTGSEEIYIKVDLVTWPTWQYAHDADVLPELWLSRPDEMSDDEWAEVFVAIDKRPSP